jgi:hypothetical protein
VATPITGMGVVMVSNSRELVETLTSAASTSNTLAPTTAPTPEQAALFALMIDSGLSPRAALAHFCEDTAVPAAVEELALRWSRSSAVHTAARALRGQDWHRLSLVERMRAGLNKHYSQLAFMLVSCDDYNALDGPHAAKHDRARAALELKIASSSGQDDAGTRFWEEFVAQKAAAAKPTATGGSSPGEPRVLRS